MLFLQIEFPSGIVCTRKRLILHFWHSLAECCVCNITKVLRRATRAECRRYAVDRHSARECCFDCFSPPEWLIVFNNNFVTCRMDSWYTLGPLHRASNNIMEGPLSIMCVYLARVLYVGWKYIQSASHSSGPIVASDFLAAAFSAQVKMQKSRRNEEKIDCDWCKSLHLGTDFLWGISHYRITPFECDFFCALIVWWSIYTLTQFVTVNSVCRTKISLYLNFQHSHQVHEKVTKNIPTRIQIEENRKMNFKLVNNLERCFQLYSFTLLLLGFEFNKKVIKRCKK
jgi:hypothetical protein